MSKSTRPDLINNGEYHVEKTPYKRIKLNQEFISDQRDLPEDDEVAIEGYGLDGKVVLDEDSMVAKRELSGKRVSYFARFSTGGSDKGRVVNPTGVHFSEGDFRAKKQSRGRLRYEFREITSQAFILYLSYLKGRNDATLREAERIISNG